MKYVGLIVLLRVCCVVNAPTFNRLFVNSSKQKVEKVAFGHCRASHWICVMDKRTL